MHGVRLAKSRVFCNELQAQKDKAPHSLHDVYQVSLDGEQQGQASVQGRAEIASMRALYDLKRFLPTFNYFEWLLIAEMDGATMVVFDTREPRTSKFGYAQTMNRFRSICEPGCALIGLPYETFTERSKEPTNAKRLENYITGGKPIVDRWKAGRKFKRLKTVKPPASERYTVTLRNSPRDPIRNSDRKVWEEFAKEIGARLIPDYLEEPIHLHDRVALYAGAEMNYFASNGPGVLCSMTEYPCMMFNSMQQGWSFTGDGVPHTSNYIWMLENQKAIWEWATPESLREYHYHWKQTGTFINRPGLLWDEGKQEFYVADYLGPIWNGSEYVTPS